MATVTQEEQNTTRVRQNTIALLLWIRKQGAQDFHISNFPFNFQCIYEIDANHPGLYNSVTVSHNRFMMQVSDTGEKFLKEHQEDVDQVFAMFPYLKS